MTYAIGPHDAYRIVLHKFQAYLSDKTSFRCHLKCERRKTNGNCWKLARVHRPHILHLFFRLSCGHSRKKCLFYFKIKNLSNLNQFHNGNFVCVNGHLSCVRVHLCKHLTSIILIQDGIGIQKQHLCNDQSGIPQNNHDAIIIIECKSNIKIFYLVTIDKQHANYYQHTDTQTLYKCMFHFHRKRCFVVWSSKKNPKCKVHIANVVWHSVELFNVRANRQSTNTTRPYSLSSDISRIFQQYPTCLFKRHRAKRSM